MNVWVWCFSPSFCTVNDWCFFRPRFCTVKATLGQRQPGRMILHCNTLLKQAYRSAVLGFDFVRLYCLGTVWVQPWLIREILVWITPLVQDKSLNLLTSVVILIIWNTHTHTHRHTHSHTHTHTHTLKLPCYHYSIVITTYFTFLHTSI